MKFLVSLDPIQLLSVWHHFNLQLFQVVFAVRNVKSETVICHTF